MIGIRWKKINADTWLSSDSYYQIVRQSFTVLVGTSRSPHRSRYTLSNVEKNLTTTTSLADAKAIAEHWEQKSTECPVIGCQSHREFV